jgi:MazG family protein
MLKNTQELLDIMARLRHPENGCAWDVKQNFASLIPYVIEEAYEVVDAIERDDMDDLRAELGDLLLQVVFHARIAEEQGLFGFDEVASSIADKLVRRHPHVFADAVYATDAERHQAWEQAKADERKAKQETAERQSVLAGVASSLPALMECEKILDRAAQHGFDWPEVGPVFDKVEEELEEIRERYGDDRRTEIVHSYDDLTIEDMISDDEMVITISHQGYIKRTPLTEYRVQNRGGVGSKATAVKDDDFTEHLFVATMHNYLLVFTHTGRMFWKKVYELPEGNKTAKTFSFPNASAAKTKVRAESMPPLNPKMALEKFNFSLLYGSKSSIQVSNVFIYFIAFQIYFLL